MSNRDWNIIGVLHYFIIFRDNEICDEGAKELAIGISQLKSLTTLKINFLYYFFLYYLVVIK